MGGQTVLVVPSTVPTATVLRRERQVAAQPTVVSAEPAVVPVARPTRLVADVLTPEQVARLRAENAELRRQLQTAR